MAETVTKLYIGGMTCAHCETAIENGLSAVSGVIEVKASYSRGTALVAYDEAEVSPERLKAAVTGAGYTVREEGARRAGKKLSPAVNTACVLAVLAGSFYLLNLSGLFGIFSFFSADAGAAAGGGAALLLLGLLTSVHCVAMCGGINLSQCIRREDTPQEDPDAGESPKDTKAACAAASPQNDSCAAACPRPCAAHTTANKKINLHAFRASFLYNLGRLISYTAIGFVVGAIGMALTLSDLGRGIVSVAAGVFMVIMGLNMLGCLPFLRYLAPRMPKAFAKKIGRRKAGGYSPLFVGLLNGLMPCGPLQTMQLYALSTGSPFLGALSMFLFALGTMPLLFILGAAGSLLTKKFTKGAMAAGSVLVVAMGLFMFSGGIAVAGLPLPVLTGGLPQTAAIAAAFLLAAAGLFLYDGGALFVKAFGGVKPKKAFDGDSDGDTGAENNTGGNGNTGADIDADTITKP